MMIHRSGECLITEHSYAHSLQMWRRLLQPFSMCNINPAKYTISKHVSIFFQVEVPERQAEQKIVTVAKNTAEEDTNEDSQLLR